MRRKIKLDEKELNIYLNASLAGALAALARLSGKVTGGDVAEVILDWSVLARQLLRVPAAKKDVALFVQWAKRVLDMQLREMEEDIMIGARQVAALARQVVQGPWPNFYKE
jgi:hypothetical protein